MNIEDDSQAVQAAPTCGLGIIRGVRSLRERRFEHFPGEVGLIPAIANLPMLGGLGRRPVRAGAMLWL